MFWNYLGVDFGDFIKYLRYVRYVHIVRNKLRRNSLLNVSQAVKTEKFVFKHIQRQKVLPATNNNIDATMYAYNPRLTNSFPK